MPWPEDIAGELPPPHPEEPAQLRSDILDELHDHLQSAIEHEQITGTDEATARNSVLARFGNPSTIACRLWWDAMWGRIMMQRITLVFVALLCCLSIVMTFMVWQAMESSQQATAALVAQVQKLAEQEAPQPSPEDERLKYLDWVPVTVKLEYEDGTSVTDEKVYATLGTPTWEQNVPHRTVTKHPDDMGTLQFGFFKPGQIELYLNMPWDERFRKTVNVEPGIPVEMTIACPRNELKETQADFDVVWPEDIRQHELWCAFAFAPVNQRIGNTLWNRSPRNFMEEFLNQEMLALINPQGDIYLINLRTQHDETVRNGYSIDLLETYLSGQFDDGSPLGFMYDLPVYASPGKDDFRRSSYPKLNIRDTLQQHVHGVLSPQTEKLSLPECDVHLNALYILKLFEQGGDAATFQMVLPIGFDLRNRNLAEEAVIKGGDWTYQPSEAIVEIVRKRLEQIDAEEKPEPEGKQEAEGVTAELK